MVMPSNKLADLIISRFRLERTDGGVVMTVSGGRNIFHTSSQCPTLILLFAGCFLFVGVVLTVLVYRPLVESNTHYLRYISGSHIAGPSVLVVGILLLGVGLALRIVSQRLQPPNNDQAAVHRQQPSAFSKLCRCLTRPTIVVTRLSSSRRSKVVQDLLSINELCRISRENSGSSYGDVASFPDSSVSSSSSNDAPDAGSLSSPCQSSSITIKNETVNTKY